MPTVFKADETKIVEFGDIQLVFFILLMFVATGPGRTWNLRQLFE
jgi:hypothetical protein